MEIRASNLGRLFWSFGTNLITELTEKPHPLNIDIVGEMSARQKSLKIKKNR
jgi:hypothetical protein